MPGHSIGSACARLALLAGVLTLAACATPPPPVAAAPPAQAGPVPVDGIYAGARQLIAAGDGPGVLCGTSAPFAVTVAGRAFQYVLAQPETPYQPTRVFDGTIGADGSFNVLSGPAGMRGTVGRGGHMQGQIDGDACSYLFQADRGTP